MCVLTITVFASSTEHKNKTKGKKVKQVKLYFIDQFYPLRYHSLKTCVWILLSVKKVKLQRITVSNRISH